MKEREYVQCTYVRLQLKVEKLIFIANIRVNRRIRRLLCKYVVLYVYIYVHTCMHVYVLRVRMQIRMYFYLLLYRAERDIYVRVNASAFHCMSIRIEDINSLGVTNAHIYTLANVSISIKRNLYLTLREKYINIVAILIGTLCKRAAFKSEELFYTQRVNIAIS